MQGITLSPRPAKGRLQGVILAYRLRWKRRRFLFRIWRKRHEISVLIDRTETIGKTDILLFCCLRNEAVRLPHFLAYYRKLGVNHFLFVDNDSTDGSAALLAKQPDASVWTTRHSYRLARFGMDWLGKLMFRFGHNHWCLVVDADELFAYADSETTTLSTLTQALERQGQHSMGALMLDLYPKGGLQEWTYHPGDDPTQMLCWFDHDNYRASYHPYYGNLWIQGGARERVFFAATPQKSPTLNKFPLIKWNRRFVYVSSTHQALPPRLHEGFDFKSGTKASGVLLHTKFLPIVAEKSAEELHRRQHFAHPEAYGPYHQALTTNLTLWTPKSTRFTNTQDLEKMKLIQRPTSTTFG